MMTDQIEDAIASAALKQGLKASAAAMRQVAVDLAGSTMTADHLISVPGKGSVSPLDYVNSLRLIMPEGFAPVTDKSASLDERRPGETLTNFMRRHVEAGRKQVRMPDNWADVRSKVTGTTAAMMDSIAAARRQGRK